VTVTRAKTEGLLTQIEAAALDGNSDLVAALRKCVALGGQSGSESLREWASRELKGYGGGDELPPYRTVAAAVAISGSTFTAIIHSQQISPRDLPQEFRDVVSETLPLRQPITEIVAIVETTQSGDGNVVRMSLPGSTSVAALMNERARELDPDRMAFQHVSNVFWEVHVTALVALVEGVRTTLVELVSEIRAGLPANDEVPSKELADQAVSVAVHGKGHRVQVNTGSASTGASIQIADPVEPETTGRRIMWWLVAVAAIITAVAAVFALHLV